MRRFLRLLTLWLLALALPIQGAAAATALSGSHAAGGAHATSGPTLHAMPMADMPDMSTHPATAGPATASAGPHASAASPCPHHTVDKADCGACCGPAMAQQPALAVTPVAALWAPAPHVASPVAAPVFLTGGPDRPPRPLLA